MGLRSRPESGTIDARNKMGGDMFATAHDRDA